MTKMKLIFFQALLLPAFIFTSGCLVTRDEVRESVKRDPLSPEQQSRANAEVRYQEIEGQMRELMGRVEGVENTLNLLSADKTGVKTERQNEKKSLEEKLKIYEEAISKLEAQCAVLAQKIEALQAPPASAKEDKSAKGNKSSYDSAEGDFTKKNYKQAIVSFQKYRDTNPTGKRYAEATFKMGQSFQELGMKTEARSFYSEVLEKFPKSDWAKKANLHLKSLK